MVKNLLQDMVVNKSSKSGTYSNPPKKKIWEEMRESKEEKYEEEEPDYNSYRYDNEEGKPKYRLWVVALFAVVMLLFALSFLFAKATININPKTKPIELSDTFSAIKESNSEGLTFDLIAISGEESRLITGTERKDGSERAKGTVVIYNSFSTSPQALAIDTRLEGSNGKIYKTETKLTVPGMKNGVPGSVEVKVYAADPGEEYNASPLDFKIFGFKGTPKYEKFYARSKGNMTGGFTGSSFTIPEEEKSKHLLELKNTLQDKLIAKAREQIPSGFILFKDAVSLSIDSESTDFVSKDSNIVISMKGTLYGFLLDEAKLTDSIAKGEIGNYDGGPAHITNITDLNFSIPNKNTISFKDAKSLVFRIEGKSNIVWDVDKEKLLSQIIGKKKKDFYQVLAEYPNIDGAELVIKPVWKNSFPEEENKITITVNEPK
ncbi:MAG: hypothetical protein KBC44_00390 [Candidatus Pacebacteria bacterium]|nr:hypothetical protein [Candidatus Paceibacterota bacterium]MBP9839424.1 hypothetical protein [Candidatus Paceibacterota bacterium]